MVSPGRQCPGVVSSSSRAQVSQPVVLLEPGAPAGTVLSRREAGRSKGVAWGNLGGPSLPKEGTAVQAE